MKFKTFRIVAAATAALLAAPAMAFVIPFAGQGLVTPVGPPDQNNDLPLAVLNTSYAIGGDGGFALTSFFTFNLDTGQGAGTFSFDRGADMLSGTLTTQFVGQGFQLSYLVTSSGGMFAGLAGTGSSSVQLLGDPQQPPTPYVEEGRFDLRAVPEPGALLLIGLGLVGIGMQRRRG